MLELQKDTNVLGEWEWDDAEDNYFMFSGFEPTPHLPMYIFAEELSRRIRYDIILNLFLKISINLGFHVTYLL